MSLEKAISIEFKSGEYGGRKRNKQPMSLRGSAARGLL